ncbi:collagen alpha-1(I) chain-like [Canis lupus familiaris]|uniref:collagen alpha-1(I) chain-like n=1 Tax=Canis lupus familiaris TaxID=9615 RepID=UPI0018F33182|nr:collagen alpha-1(I) chain-like [Canis lupus familiaris]
MVLCQGNAASQSTPTLLGQLQGTDAPPRPPPPGNALEPAAVSPAHSGVSYQGLCAEQASGDGLLANSSRGPWTLPGLKPSSPKPCSTHRAPGGGGEREGGRRATARNRASCGEALDSRGDAGFPPEDAPGLPGRCRPCPTDVLAFCAPAPSSFPACPPGREPAAEAGAHGAPGPWGRGGGPAAAQVGTAGRRWPRARRGGGAAGDLEPPHPGSPPGPPPRPGNRRQTFPGSLGPRGRGSPPAPPSPAPRVAAGRSLHLRAAPPSSRCSSRVRPPAPPGGSPRRRRSRGNAEPGAEWPLQSREGAVGAPHRDPPGRGRGRGAEHPHPAGFGLRLPRPRLIAHAQ